MAIVDIFSKRQARLRGEGPDVYKYDEISDRLRVQLVHLTGDLLNGGRSDQLRYNAQVNSAYTTINEILCREHGRFRLSGESYQERDYAAELFNFILRSENYEHVLDAVELVVRYADRFTRKWSFLREEDFNSRVDNGIDELNQRFKEHGLGYQYEDGELVRVDSDLLHAEAVKPALTLLRTEHYTGPRQEFLRAYEHYRHERFEEAMVDALKSFESTMKVISDAKGWTYDKGATAKKLVDVCFKNGLIDPFWQTHISHLQGTLESGISTARNKLGAHGQGALPRTVPRELVGYVLHMTASTIVFLIESAGS